jgi:hypothetical protein
LTDAGLKVRTFVDPEELINECDDRASEVVAVISSMMESSGRKEAGKRSAFGLFSLWRAECYRRGCRAPIFAIVSKSVDVNAAFAAGADVVEHNWENVQNGVVMKLGGRGKKSLLVRLESVRRQGTEAIRRQGL